MACVVLAGAAPFSEAGQLVGAFVMPHGAFIESIIAIISVVRGGARAA